MKYFIYYLFYWWVEVFDYLGHKTAQTRYEIDEAKDLKIRHCENEAACFINGVKVTYKELYKLSK